jgi:cytochrome c oxidase cbb3-type subunit 2
MAFDIHTNHRLFFGIAFGTYLVLTLLVAILPAAQMTAAWRPGPVPQEPLVLRGRAVYQAEGCWNCHTQQIRGDERLPRDESGHVPVLSADRRFGLDAPTTAEFYVSDAPPFLGTQRTGPDLTAAGSRQPDPHWHYWHLYDPQSVSPDSNMPAVPWYFYVDERPRDPEDEEVAPLAALALPRGRRLYATKDARALVEYLLSLTRPEVTR